MNKKGMIDVITFVVLLFTFSLVTVIGVTVYNAYYNAVKDVSSDQKAMLDIVTPVFEIQDIVFMLILVGGIIGLVVSAFYIPTNPIYFFISIIIIIFTVFMGGLLSNVFTQVYNSTADLNATAANYPMMTGIWDKMPTIIMVVIFIFGIVLYAKFRGVIGEV